MDVESALKIVGGMGRFQKFIVTICSLGNIAYGGQMVMMVIIGATPNSDIPSERNLSTIVTEWKLQDEQWIVDLMSSLFMVGYGVGCVICGQVSDLYGRKWIFIINYVGFCLAGIGSAFCQNWKTFAVTRCIAGFCTGASGHVLFALLVENIGKKFWGPIGMAYSVFFSFGVMLLSLFGYIFLDWRKVCIVMSSLPLALVPVQIFLIPESSRWLYHVGKVEKAEKVLVYIAEKNGRPSTGITLRRANDNELILSEDLKKYSVIDMFSRKKLAIYALSSFYIWFACSFVYYGLTLDASMLSPNIYIANILSGAIEIPALILTFLCMRSKCLGRKGTLIICFTLSSVSSIGLLFADGLQLENLPLAQTILGLMNKLSVAGAFSLLYVYCAEIFPTQLRLVAIGGSSMFARVGSIISPFVPLMVPVRSYLPYIVFGVVAVLGGASNLFLPETLNRPTPDMSDYSKKPKREVDDCLDADDVFFANDEMDSLVRV